MSTQTTCLLILLIVFCIGIDVVTSAFIPVKSCNAECPNVLMCCWRYSFFVGGYCKNGRALCT